MIKKNIRIQLYDKEGMLSERMVSQDIELKAGPKDIHQGSMRIEFTVEESNDVDLLINYLQKLRGLVPIQSIIKQRGRQPGTLNNDDNFTADKAKMLSDLLQANTENQDGLIKGLRELGFYFVTSDYLKMIIPEAYSIKKVHLENYEWLIRRTKEAKDPKNDKYDPQVLVGIRIMNERSDKIVTYLYGEDPIRYNVPVPSKKPMTMAKTNLIKYPQYMNEEERFKWGTEHRLMLSNKERKASKFYKRWYKDVKVGNELQIEDLESRLE